MSTQFREHPPAPAFIRVDTEDPDERRAPEKRIILSPLPKLAWRVTSGEFIIYEIHGKDATLGQVVAFILNDYQCGEPWMSDLVVWADSRMHAIVRTLPFDGRRVVLYPSDRGGAARVFYPAHPELELFV